LDSSCYSSQFNIFCTLPPLLLEDNRHIIIGPYNTHYPSLTRHLQTCGLDPLLNKWDTPIVYSKKVVRHIYKNLQKPQTHRQSHEKALSLGSFRGLELDEILQMGETDSESDDEEGVEPLLQQKDGSGTDGSVSEGKGEPFRSDAPAILRGDEKYQNMYQLQSSDTFVPFTIPFNLKGNTIENPVPLSGEYKLALQRQTERYFQKLTELAREPSRSRHLQSVITNKFQEWLTCSGHLDQVEQLVALHLATSGFRQ